MALQQVATDSRCHQASRTEPTHQRGCTSTQNRTARPANPRNMLRSSLTDDRT
jgi:hypothetical protein